MLLFSAAGNGEAHEEEPRGVFAGGASSDESFTPFPLERNFQKANEERVENGEEDVQIESPPNKLEQAPL